LTDIYTFIDTSYEKNIIIKIQIRPRVKVDDLYYKSNNTDGFEH